MSFDLDVSPTFAATVQITVPGKPSRPLKLTFNHMDSEPLEEFVRTAHTRTNLENARLMVASVEDRPQGVGVDTDEAFFARLFQKFPASPKDLFSAFLQELTESRTKN